MVIKLIQLSFARLGYIKIGDKGGTSGAPRKFDHFEIRTTAKDSEGNLIPDYPMMERLGEKPTSLKIRIPFNDLDLVFPNTLAYYRGQVRYCWGDGETAQRLSGEGNGKYPRFGPPKDYGPCGESCVDFQKRRCKPLGALQVILEEQQQLGGAYVFKTTSWNSIRNIITALTSIKAQAGGMIAWVPLTMKLVPQIVQPKDGGAANTAYIVQILFEGTPQQLLSTVRELLAMRAPLIQELRELEAGLKALPPAEEDAGEAADTQEEFYPEMREAVAHIGETTSLEVEGEKSTEDEHPTAEQVNGLAELMRSCGLDVNAHMRQLLGLPEDATVSKKIVRETMNIEQYNSAWMFYINKLHDEDDVHDFSGPSPTQADALQDDAQVSGEGTSDTHPTAASSEASSVVGDPVEVQGGDNFGGTDAYQASAGFHTSDMHEAPGAGKYATTNQIAQLKRTAGQVGDDAYVDVQDLLDHHKERLTVDVYETVLQRLKGRLAAAKAGVQTTTEG